MARIILALIVSAFISAMLAGPGMLLYPQCMRWIESSVCADGEQLMYHWKPTSRGSTLLGDCTKPDGSVTAANMGTVFEQLFVRSFIPLFVILILLFGFRKRGAAQTTAMPSVQVSFGGNPADLQQQLRTLLGAGDKIQAIKIVRQFSGSGLKEAKDLVEALHAGTIDISKFTSQMGATTGAVPNISEDVPTRLKKLEELHVQKLITEEEYLQKRKEILAQV